MTRHFTLDLPNEDRAPQVGDVLVGKVAIYQVGSVRPVESRVWPFRWKLTLERIGTVGGEPPTVDSDEPHVTYFESYPKGTDVREHWRKRGVTP